MAGEVRSLWVSLKARTSAFESGMRRARKELGGFVSAIPGANLLVSKFSAVLTVAGAAGFALWVRRSGEALDATAKFADSLGFSIEKFQALTYAGDLAGVSTEQIETAMRTMTRAVDDASRGTGGAVDAFRRLGISARDLKRLSPDEQVKAIADALAKVPDAATKAALAMEVFGSRSLGVVNLFGGGRKTLDDAEKRLVSLGLTMGRLDVSKVEAANDAFTDLGVIVSGIGQRFAVELAPFIKAAADEAVEWVKRMGGVGNIVSEAIGHAIEGVGFLTRAFSALKAVVHGFEVVFLGIANAFLNVIQQTVGALEWAIKTASKIAKHLPLPGGLGNLIPELEVDLGSAALKKSAEDAGKLLGAAWKSLNASVESASSTAMEQQVKAWIDRARMASDAAAAATTTGAKSGKEAPFPWREGGDWRRERDKTADEMLDALLDIRDNTAKPKPAIMVP